MKILLMMMAVAAGWAQTTPTTIGVVAADGYFTYTSPPSSAVAGNTLSRLSLTGPVDPSGEYLDANYTSELTVRRTVTKPSHTPQSGETSILTGQLIRMSFVPSASWDNSPTLAVSSSGATILASYPSGAANPMNRLSGGIIEAYNRGSGAINTQRGLYVSSGVYGASDVTFLNDGLNVSAINTGTGTVANTRGLVVTAGPGESTPGSTTSVAVVRGTAYTYAAIGTAYGYRMTRSGSVNPSTAWGISEETGWPSRLNGRLAVNKLTDDGSSALQVAGRIQASLETPASSSAACVAGQMVWDASYLYVCVATNTWKRKLLDSF